MTADEGADAPRTVGAAVTGVAAGAGGFLLLLLAGWLLYQRLWPDSVAALAIVIVLFGAAGAFAGWMVGMIVFSAVRDYGGRSS
jgi:hypothetical protein